MAALPKTDYGLREDGTPKGEGYFGPIGRRNGHGAISSELSITVEWDGKEHLIPTMVPTLTRDELMYLLSTDPSNLRGPMMDRIEAKAVEFARKRLKQGKSVWSEPGEFFPFPRQ